MGHEIFCGGEHAELQHTGLNSAQFADQIFCFTQRAQHALHVNEEVFASERQADHVVLRSNRGRRTADSSCLICIDTAGAVRCSSSAARAKLRCLATEANTCTWRTVTGSIRDSLSGR